MDRSLHVDGTMGYRFRALAFCLAALAPAGAAFANIDASDVKRVMAEHNGEIRACYQRHAKGQDGATGEVTLDVGVAPKGVVDDVKLDAPGVSSKAFTRCVNKRVKKWRFPENNGTVVTIPYKFYFSR